MLTLCREASALTQAQLADAAGFSKAYISKAESGVAEVSEERARRLATELNCPPELFEDGVLGPSDSVTCIHNRQRASRMPALTRRKIGAVAALTAVSVGRVMARELDAQRLERLRGLRGHGPEERARAARSSLGLGTAPIDSVVVALESLGVSVVRRSLGSTLQDGMSVWPDGGVPVVIVNEGVPVDRLRFTLAHELGHLILHAVPTDEQEDEANAFASEFLLPTVSAREVLDGLTASDFRRMLELKGVWGMSIAAIARRARDIGVFSPEQYRNAMIQLSGLGWRKQEPGHGGIEPDSQFTVACFTRAATDAGLNEVAREALMQPDAFSRVFLGKARQAREVG
jgi:Zn-dependent peptidase ImmA (M78 family)/transcriptional regulator with XRE-family HTH domain